MTVFYDTQPIGRGIVRVTMWNGLILWLSDDGSLTGSPASVRRFNSLSSAWDAADAIRPLAGVFNAECVGVSDLWALTGQDWRS